MKKKMIKTVATMLAILMLAMPVASLADEESGAVETTQSSSGESSGSAHSGESKSSGSAGSSHGGESKASESSSAHSSESKSSEASSGSSSESKSSGSAGSSHGGESKTSEGSGAHSSESKPSEASTGSSEVKASVSSAESNSESKTSESSGAHSSESKPSEASTGSVETKPAEGSSDSAQAKSAEGGAETRPAEGVSEGKSSEDGASTDKGSENPAPAQADDAGANAETAASTETAGSTETQADTDSAEAKPAEGSSDTAGAKAAEDGESSSEGGSANGSSSGSAKKSTARGGAGASQDDDSADHGIVTAAVAAAGAGELEQAAAANDGEAAVDEANAGTLGVVVDQDRGILAAARISAAPDDAGSDDSSGLITERKQQDDSQIDTTFGDPDDVDQKGNITNVESSYALCVDENGVYQLTFTIQEGVDAENITVDLTKALEELQAYAGATGMNTFEPGDTRAFQIWITSDSQHTYRYTEGSFILTTPEADAEDIPEEPVTGFDGQELDKDHTGRTSRDAYTNLPAIQEILEEMGLDAYDRRFPSISAQNRLVSILKNRYNTSDISEAVMQCLVDYYSKKDGTDYASFEEMLKNSPDAAKDIENTGGRQISGAKLPADGAQLYNFWYNEIHRFVYGDEDDVHEATGDNKDPTTTTKTIYTVTDHDDGKVYTDCYPASKLGSYYVRRIAQFSNMGYFTNPENVLCYVDPATGRFIFGFANEDGSWAEIGNYDGTSRTLTTHEASFENVEWHRIEGLKDTTVADYMQGEDSDAWQKADAYFNQLLADGISASEASARTEKMVEFWMATNVDGALAGNGYQNTEWGWHNTIDLERVDGELTVQKVDENGEAINETTRFQLWYYDDTDKDGKYTEDDTAYYYTKHDVNGESILGFVEYDKSKDRMTYTFDVNGELTIDYAMLEGIIYYLQEAVAPSGYVKDTTVYIMCDEETYDRAQSMLKDGGVDTSAGFKYGGRIDSETPITIKLVNRKVPTPPTPPTPDDDDDNPPTPPVPGLVDLMDYDTPLAGAINMNEGDCFN